MLDKPEICERESEKGRRRKERKEKKRKRKTNSQNHELTASYIQSTDTENHTG
jgi:hypothetical protein